MTDQPEPQRTRIQQKNRDLILEGALTVFSESGFRGATIDQPTLQQVYRGKIQKHAYPRAEAVLGALVIVFPLIQLANMVNIMTNTP